MRTWSRRAGLRRRSGRTSDAQWRGFGTGRLLERAFSEERKPFVQGRQGILARTVDARYTIDTDFLYRGDDLEEAFGELKRPASKDLALHVTRYGMAGSDLSSAIEKEAGMMRLGPLDAFTVPGSWRGPHEGACRKCIRQLKSRHLGMLTIFRT